MRIVFWNIRAGGGTRVKRIARQLDSWAPDTVVLCEFRATPPSLELARALASFGLVHQCTTADPARPNANRLLIATRWPLRRVRIRAEPSEPGRWLLASVDARRPLTFGAMHVPNRMSGRKDIFFAAVLTVLGRWRRGPLLLIGLARRVPAAAWSGARVHLVFAEPGQWLSARPGLRQLRAAASSPRRPLCLGETSSTRGQYPERSRRALARSPRRAQAPRCYDGVNCVDFARGPSY